MKYACLAFIFLSFLHTRAQALHQALIVLEPEQEKEILIAAYAEDTLTFNFSVENAKKTKKNRIYFYNPSKNLMVNTPFSRDFETTITANTNGIYRLLLKNENKKKATYQLSYYLNSTRKKKPEIGYAVKKDTTYGPKVRYLAATNFLETIPIQKEQFYINSTSNALVKGGKNRIIIPVNLPPNTQEWYYVFSASREEEDINNTLSSFNLAAQLTKFVKEDVSIQNAVQNLSPPPGAHICDVYVIHSEKDAELFKEKEDFTSSLEGSRENFKSGIVQVSTTGKTYLGIRNPDNLYGIHVAIEIIAVVAQTKEIEKSILIPIIRTYQEPYFIE